MKKQFYLNLLISFISVILLPLIACSTWAETASFDVPSSPQVQTVLPDDLQWRTNPDIAGVQSAIALGEPSNSGLYVLFGKMDAGATFPAHTHPDERITTVLSGVMYTLLENSLIALTFNLIQQEQSFIHQQVHHILCGQKMARQ